MARSVIGRSYDGTVVRWMDCVARNGHRFNASDTCMDCGAKRRGPAVKMVCGGMPKREKK